ncbi:hypothetical protein GQ42DRAFT_36781 [Ramicandelaber brevisporus]|nr:hypothetical protein GQ42DRAFT_36781 [Ramicandelaber brevisporus]
MTPSDDLDDCWRRLTLADAQRHSAATATTATVTAAAATAAALVDLTTLLPSKGNTDDERVLAIHAASVRVGAIHRGRVALVEPPLATVSRALSDLADGLLMVIDQPWTVNGGDVFEEKRRLAQGICSALDLMQGILVCVYSSVGDDNDNDNAASSDEVTLRRRHSMDGLGRPIDVVLESAPMVAVISGLGDQSQRKVSLDDDITRQGCVAPSARGSLIVAIVESLISAYLTASFWMATLSTELTVSGLLDATTDVNRAANESSDLNDQMQCLAITVSKKVVGLLLDIGVRRRYFSNDRSLAIVLHAIVQSSLVDAWRLPVCATLTDYLLYEIEQFEECARFYLTRSLDPHRDSLYTIIDLANSLKPGCSPTASERLRRLLDNHDAASVDSGPSKSEPTLIDLSEFVNEMMPGLDLSDKSLYRPTARPNGLIASGDASVQAPVLITKTAAEMAASGGMTTTTTNSSAGVKTYSMNEFREAHIARNTLNKGRLPSKHVDEFRPSPPSTAAAPPAVSTSPLASPARIQHPHVPPSALGSVRPSPPHPSARPSFQQPMSTGSSFHTPVSSATSASGYPLRPTLPPVSSFSTHTHSFQHTAQQLQPQHTRPPLYGFGQGVPINPYSAPDFPTVPGQFPYSSQHSSGMPMYNSGGGELPGLMSVGGGGGGGGGGLPADQSYFIQSQQNAHQAQHPLSQAHMPVFESYGVGAGGGGTMYPSFYGQNSMAGGGGSLLPSSSTSAGIVRPNPGFGKGHGMASVSSAQPQFIRPAQPPSNNLVQPKPMSTTAAPFTPRKK